MVRITSEPIDPAKAYDLLTVKDAGSVLLHYAVVKPQKGNGGTTCHIDYATKGDAEAELGGIARHQPLEENENHRQERGLRLSCKKRRPKADHDSTFLHGPRCHQAFGSGRRRRHPAVGPLRLRRCLPDHLRQVSGQGGAGGAGQPPLDPAAGGGGLSAAAFAGQERLAGLAP